ncbi:COG4705 family protein [Tsukamurella soli]|uniref:Uncharacterized protein n=1 Tax=Tsukamurella soli TaxID=644556 RepID=A0ABP8JRB6_9ACTN
MTTVRRLPVRPGALRVPAITAVFWLVKALSTAFGESASDAMVTDMVPEIAVGLGFVGFCAALALQLRRGRYVAWTYRLAVVATFAMGTASGDFAADTLHLGYLPAALLFAVAITVPAAGYRRPHWNPVVCFWAAYVITRPLGASIADWLGKPRAAWRRAGRRASGADPGRGDRRARGVPDGDPIRRAGSRRRLRPRSRLTGGVPARPGPRVPACSRSR